MRLNLGCGENWKLYPDYIGVDLVDYGQKYVGDAKVIIKMVLDREEVCEEIMANHFLEHLSQDQLRGVLNAAHRLLRRSGGIFRAVVPHMKKDRAWVLSHRTFWNEETVRWLAEEETEFYRFRPWRILECVTNERMDIHWTMSPV